MTTYWIDFSGARPSAKSIKDAGAEGVIRYLSAEVPATAWKRATKAEIQSYLAVGLDVILNYEWYEGRMLEGYSAGYEDGKIALKQAQNIGYPRGATIYFSHDTGARNDSNVRNYMRGVVNALNGYYQADVYSGYDTVEMVMSSGLARYGWQTLAWSGGRIGGAHIYQNGNRWFSSGADENVIRQKPLGSWLETLNGQGKPTPKPKPPKKPIKPKVVYHVVRPGESLSILATRYKTTVAKLVEWNKAKFSSLRSDPDLIQVGWKLQVSTGTGGTAGPDRPKPKPRPTKVKIYHKVKTGETLWALASHYGTTVAQIQAWNLAEYPGLKNNPDTIYPGWRLRVR